MTPLRLLYEMQININDPSQCCKLAATAHYYITLLQRVLEMAEESNRLDAIRHQ